MESQEHTEVAATCPVINFDHHAPEHAVDPWETYKRLRETCPVARTEVYGGFNVVTRYRDVVAIAQDWGTFSSAHDIDGSGNGYQGVTIPPPPVRGLPTEVDPPEHTSYRKILQPLFARRAVEAHAPQISAIVDSFIDRVIEAGECDLIDDITAAVPAAVTLELLGLPTDEWRRYADPMHKIVYAPQGSQEYAQATEGSAWILERVREEIESRRRDDVNRNDVLGTLLQASIDSEPLSNQAILDLVWLVIVGGLDNTSSVLAHALLHLHRDHAARDRIRGNTPLLRTSFHEYLRYFSVTQALARTATRDTEVGGVPIREGERVFISWASANRDPDVFDRPDELELDRSPNRHVSFGVGVHRCVGAVLAEEMFVITMRRVLERIGDYVIDEASLDPYPSAGIAVGYINMPARFTASRPLR